MSATVITIIADHLRANGFDGLVNLDAECACELGDLAPFCDDIRSCNPGYRHMTPGGEYDWIMSTKKTRSATRRCEAAPPVKD